MPSLGECLRRITPAAAMVDDFEWNKKTLTKHNFYLAFLRKPDAKKLNNFGTQNRPSTHVIDATSCVQIWNTTIWAEKLNYILSYQM